jgi:SAM-dependent methyltransferase
MDGLSRNRYNIIKKYINLHENMNVLGIGEGCRQTIPSSEVKTFYNCDYFSNEEMSQQNLSNIIVNIDFICKDNDYLKAINKDEYFDLIISNHCIEHLDNFILFFKQMNVLLNEGGYIFFTLPDKKYSFDKLRNNTEISHLIFDYIYNDTNQHLLHLIETEIFYNYEPVKFAKDRIKLKKYNKSHELTDNRFTSSIHPGIHRHVFEFETFVDKIINPMLYLYFDNFELIVCDKTSNGEFFTILQKKTNAIINFPEKLFEI